MPDCVGFRASVDGISLMSYTIIVARKRMQGVIIAH